MTAGSSFKWAENCLNGLQASVRVMKAGYAVHCPLLQGLFMQNDFEYDDIIRLDLAILERCDYLLLMDGWEESRGAREEKDVADDIGLPVFTSLDELIEEVG